MLRRPIVDVSLLDESELCVTSARRRNLVPPGGLDFGPAMEIGRRRFLQSGHVCFPKRMGHGAGMGLNQFPDAA